MRGARLRDQLAQTSGVAAEIVDRWLAGSMDGIAPADARAIALASSNLRRARKRPPRARPAPAAAWAPPPRLGTVSRGGDR